MNSRETEPARRVMVVEDDLMVALHLEDVLLESNYEVVCTALTGKDALRCIEEDKVEAALLDLDLAEEWEGVDVAASLRQRQIPFVLVTAHSPEELVDPALRGVPLVQKPWNADTVLEKLGEVLNARTRLD